MRQLLVIPVVLLTVTASVLAQSLHPVHSPSALQQNNPIPNLSPEQVKGYLSGSGMGVARAGELNHYPGPRHVLDLTKALQLSQQQTDALQQIYNKMHWAAVPLGQQLVDKERELNRLFALGHPDERSLQALVDELATLEGKLRFVHLRAHIETKSVLTTAQVAKYDQLRGYLSNR